MAVAFLLYVLHLSHPSRAQKDEKIGTWGHINVAGLILETVFAVRTCLVIHHTGNRSALLGVPCVSAAVWEFDTGMLV